MFITDSIPTDERHKIYCIVSNTTEYQPTAQEAVCLHSMQDYSEKKRSLSLILAIHQIIGQKGLLYIGKRTIEGC